MPLHISEIGVRMAISDAGDSGEPGEKGEAASSGGGCGASSGGMSAAQRSALVEECVRGVLATLNLNERR